MPGLLPSLDELKTITGNPSLITGPVFNAVETPNPGEQTFEPADCVSSFNAGAPPAYQNSGYLAFHGASQAQSPTPSLMLGEAVATFHTAEAAQKALAAYIEQWRRCATKRFTWNFVSQGQQSQWTLGQPVDAGGGVTSLRNVNDNSPSRSPARSQPKTTCWSTCKSWAAGSPSKTSPSPTESSSASQAER